MNRISELIATAEGLVPALAERAPRCEALRRVPDETIDELTAAGLYRVSQPAKYGGYELSPKVIFDIAMVLARGCPSTAWCYCLVAVHNWEIGLLDPRIAHDIWDANPDSRISSSYAPFGRVKRVDGGFELSGRWPWSSGCDHCDWVNVGARPEDPDAAIPPGSFLVPRPDYEIDDTWHVAGLKGTGSKDIVMEKAFVPAYRRHDFASSFAMTDPGRATFEAPCYRYPFGTVFTYCLASVTQGIAEAALETYRAQMQDRRHAYDGGRSSEDPFTLQRLARADNRIRSNRAAIDSAFAEMDRRIAQASELSVPFRAELKWRAQALAADNADLVTDLVRGAGGSAMRLDNPLQRFFRDINTAVNHAFLNTERGAIAAGSLLLGGEVIDRTI